MATEMVRGSPTRFITTRTTRKVGLGSLLKEAAEACQGGLQMNRGRAPALESMSTFQRSHIDRMPLGDLPANLLTF